MASEKMVLNWFGRMLLLRSQLYKIIRQHEFDMPPNQAILGNFSVIRYHMGNTFNLTSISSTRIRLDDIGKLQLRLLLRCIHQALPSTKAEQIRCDLAHLDLLTALRDTVSAMMPPDVLKGIVP